MPTQQKNRNRSAGLGPNLNPRSHSNAQARRALECELGLRLGLRPALRLRFLLSRHFGAVPMKRIYSCRPTLLSSLGALAGSVMRTVVSVRPSISTPALESIDFVHTTISFITRRGHSSRSLLGSGLARIITWILDRGQFSYTPCCKTRETLNSRRQLCSLSADFPKKFYC